jgi:hypothetical protein
VASSRTMVVNMIGQLAGGITFSYELRLMNFCTVGKVSMCRITSQDISYVGKILTPKNSLMPQNGPKRF